MVDAIKFRPENIAPSEFMRPPTEPFALQTGVNCLLQEDKVNEAAAEAGAQVWARKRGIRPILRVGSELEIILFAADSIPHEDKDKPGYNPNYSSLHSSNIAKTKKDLLQGSKGGLQDILTEYIDMETSLCMEIRTRPMDVAGYLQAMDRIKDWFQTHAAQYGIQPVIWSQHLHMSLVDQDSRANLFNKASVDAVSSGIVDMYHRAIPLLRLPENVEDEEEKYYIGAGDGVLFKGTKYYDSDPRRIEGRMNNSDYAFDPRVNLFLNLAGMHRGLEHLLNPSELDEDCPLEKTIGGQRYFTIGDGETSFHESREHLLEDEVLTKYVPGELLRGFYNTIQVYPDVSEGRMSVGEARERAYAMVADGTAGKLPQKEVLVSAEASYQVG